MPSKIPPFILYFEARFLENYSQLSTDAHKTIEKTTQLLAHNPRHPSLQVHKANNVTAKYPLGGTDVFIAYASKVLRVTFEYGPEPGMIAIRDCGYHDLRERHP